MRDPLRTEKDTTTGHRLSRDYVMRARAGGGGAFPRCRLDVSVGQPYHEGEKFKAAVDWVNRYAGAPFDSCDLIVVDSLQRHTTVALEGLEPVAAYCRAIRAGDEWLARNREAIAAFAVPMRLWRWDELLASPRYAELRTRLERLLVAEPRFGDAIRRGAAQFAERLRQRGVPLRDEDRLLRCSTDYLLEEMAVIAFLQEDRPGIDCYPGSWLPFQAIEADIPGLPRGLRGLDWVQLRPKRRRAAHPRASVHG
jgi:tRNA-dependent cyclodipeptide synthase